MKGFSCIVFILLYFTSFSFAQSDHEKDSLMFITKYTVTKQQIQTISFEGTIDRKVALSAVLDKTRRFKVYAERNPSNKSYNFDWQISELNSNGEKRILFFTENDFFEVLKDKKQVNVLEDIGKLDAQTEMEILRSQLLPDEILYRQADLKQTGQTTFEDDGEHYKMYRQEAADFLRIVCYNKQYLYPENTDLIKSYPNMTALDITSVRLMDIKINEELPESTFSLEYYLNNGFKVNFINPVVNQTLSTSSEPARSNDALSETIITRNTETMAETKAKETQSEFLQSNVNKLLNTELETAKGWETTIGQFHNKEFLLVDFWAATSSPSMDDLHTVQSLHRDFRKKGLRVFGVNCQDYKQKKTVVKNLKQKGITFVTLFGNRANLKKWEIQNTPTYVLLDRDGKIIVQGGSEILSDVRGYLNSIN